MTEFQKWHTLAMELAQKAKEQDDIKWYRLAGYCEERASRHVTGEGKAMVLRSAACLNYAAQNYSVCLNIAQKALLFTKDETEIENLNFIINKATAKSLHK